MKCFDTWVYLILTVFCCDLKGTCARRTTSRYCCSFPFIYKGRRYHRCTRRNHKRPWCATTPNYDRDKKWGNCAGLLTCVTQQQFGWQFVDILIFFPIVSTCPVCVSFLFLSIVSPRFCFHSLLGRRPVKPVKPVIRPPKGKSKLGRYNCSTFLPWQPFFELRRFFRGLFFVI